MSQEDILGFLEHRIGSWFSIRDMEESLNITNCAINNSMSRLLKCSGLWNLEQVDCFYEKKGVKKFFMYRVNEVSE